MRNHLRILTPLLTCGVVIGFFSLVGYVAYQREAWSFVIAGGLLALIGVLFAAEEWAVARKQIKALKQPPFTTERG